MLFDHCLNFDLILGLHRFNINHIFIAKPFKGMLRIEYIRNSTAHSGGKVSSSLAKDYHSPSSHVLTGMISYSFDDGVHARVSHAEPLASLPTNVGFA